MIDDLRDGVRLLALLEVLSGERLPMERGRVLRRPHYLSNINTALEFLRGKRVSEEYIDNVMVIRNHRSMSHVFADSQSCSSADKKVVMDKKLMALVMD